ncbi:MAG: hypothetical protein LKK19_01575 [Bacteroidales bacterium]|jgi:hypothetical protein|nr:hypothetical protein [Bacteroidales bacterium]MCI2121376.1 hypothetical protein [Bacteroidales bacterium]MCI2145505.1 hypothetical protein [Bacteroidales bacterium]
MNDTVTIRTNGTFSLKRFGKYLKKDFHDYFTTYTISYISVIGITIVLWLLNLLSTSAAGDKSPFMIPPAARLTKIAFWTILFSIIAVTVVYGKRNMPGYAIHSIMLPASSLEKFISMVIILPIFTFALIFISLGLVDGLLSLFGSGIYSPGTILTTEHFWKKFLDIFFLNFAIQSYFVLCNSIFKKHKIGYAILILIGAGLLFSIITTIIVATKSPLADFIEKSISGSATLVFNGDLSSSADFENLEVSVKAFSIVCKWIYYLLPFLFWGLTYHKMRQIKY